MSQQNISWKISLNRREVLIFVGILFVFTVLIGSTSFLIHKKDLLGSMGVYLQIPLTLFGGILWVFVLSGVFISTRSSGMSLENDVLNCEASPVPLKIPVESIKGVRLVDFRIFTLIRIKMRPSVGLTGHLKEPRKMLADLGLLLSRDSLFVPLEFLNIEVNDLAQKMASLVDVSRERNETVDRSLDDSVFIKPSEEPSLLLNWLNEQKRGVPFNKKPEKKGKKKVV